MADRYIQEATGAVSPIYDQQQAQLQAQIPQLQEIFQTIRGGLQTQSQQQISSGTKDILESASQRGVLRSTLPVDAQQALTAQIGAALAQSLGNIGLQETQQIGGLQSQIGQLGIDRTKSIYDLAGTLYNRDLQERDYQLKQQQAQRDYELAQKQLALKSSGSGGLSVSEQTALMKQALQQDIANAFGAKGANAKLYTERTVLPALYGAYGVLGNDFINKAVYNYRKNALGY